MHAPVLVTPPAPAPLPVTLDEAKAHLRVDSTDEDGLIEALLDAAVSHLDGWTGVLGRCLEEQTWRQDFDCIQRCLRLPLGPVIDVVSVTWRNSGGEIATISSDDYALKNDGLGGYVRFEDAYSLPGDLYEVGAVTVTYRAGYSPSEGASTVPAAIKAAILLMVAHWFNNREAASDLNLSAVPLGVDALLRPYRRMGM